MAKAKKDNQPKDHDSDVVPGTDDEMEELGAGDQSRACEYVQVICLPMNFLTTHLQCWLLAHSL